MTLFERLTKKAQEHPQRLVLPESLEPRTLQAADRVIAQNIADVTFIGKRDEILAKAAELGLNNIEKANVINPEDITVTEPYAELFCELRKSKGMTLDQAREVVLNPHYLGCLLIKLYLIN
ncbi:MAG: phosphate acetyltransferase, partial [Muribaculaceae bacterium]|nr:phosphate acetyltransferase [Muribaculaceae bacterium]